MEIKMTTVSATIATVTLSKEEVLELCEVLGKVWYPSKYIVDLYTALYIG